MTIAIHQPDYIPYLGYFHKISQADKFIFLDDAQFSNDNMHNWNRIKTPSGEMRLKIPVEYSFGDSITAVRTKDELGWKQKHLKAMLMNYKKAAYFNEIYPEFERLLCEDYSSLAELNISLIGYICQRFGFRAELLRSSLMGSTAKKEGRVIELCLKAGGDAYYSGLGAAAYQSEENFKKAGIVLKYTDYKPAVYDQLWCKRQGFLENMSVIDFVFNCHFDFERVERSVREQNRRWK